MTRGFFAFTPALILCAVLLTSALILSSQVLTAQTMTTIHEKRAHAKNAALSCMSFAVYELSANNTYTPSTVDNDAWLAPDTTCIIQSVQRTDDTFIITTSGTYRGIAAELYGETTQISNSINLSFLVLFFI